MGTSFVSVKDVAVAQFEFRDEDWAERSRSARELAFSINGYEVSPRPRGYACHRSQWVWVEADPGGRRVRGATSGCSFRPIRSPRSRYTSPARPPERANCSIA